jgi:hypothetical protein
MGHCNMRFVGPPGVGKTVVAKIVGRILSACGLVQLRGETPAEIECVEMTKASIVGEAVGTTSPKAQAFLEQHVGRVIMFDEANSFGKGGEFAAEAASVINGFLDKYKGRVCMIVAGKTPCSLGVHSAGRHLHVAYTSTTAHLTPRAHPHRIRR